MEDAAAFHCDNRRRPVMRANNYCAIAVALMLLSTVPFGVATSTGVPATSRTISPAADEPCISTLFRDDFDGVALNANDWQMYTNGGSVVIVSGTVTLSNTTSMTFPYVYLKRNVIPKQDAFSVAIGIQYDTAAAHGDGFAIDISTPVNGQFDTHLIAAAWQGSIDGFYVAGLGGIYYQRGAPHLDYHLVTFRWDHDQVQFFVDGQLVGSESAATRPTSLWFGNHRAIPASAPWSSFRLDFVQVSSLTCHRFLPLVLR
jgi:hypothetical protein